MNKLEASQQLLISLNLTALDIGCDPGEIMDHITPCGWAITKHLCYHVYDVWCSVKNLIDGDHSSEELKDWELACALFPSDPMQPYFVNCHGVFLTKYWPEWEKLTPSAWKEISNTQPHLVRYQLLYT